MYSLHQSFSVVKRNINPRFVDIPKSEILISLRRIGSNVENDIFVRDIDRGSSSKLRYVQGNYTGNWISVPQGETELLIPVSDPLTPYDVEFIPGYYLWDYDISISISIPSPVTTAFLDKYGLSNIEASQIPNQLISFLQGLDLMASSDTRNMIAGIELASTLASQAKAKADTAQAVADSASAELVSVSANMVEQRDYSIVSAAFSAEGDYMVATIVHELTGSKPQLSLLDNSGDEQGFAQLIAVNPSTVKVELTNGQFADADFPFVLSIQGKRGVEDVDSGFRTTPTMAYQWRVLNGELQNSTNGVDVLNPSFISGVVDAWISNDGKLYIQNANGYFYLNDNDLAAGWITTEQVDYGTAKTTTMAYLLSGSSNAA